MTGFDIFFPSVESNFRQAGRVSLSKWHLCMKLLCSKRMKAQVCTTTCETRKTIQSLSTHPHHYLYNSSQLPGLLTISPASEPLFAITSVWNVLPVHFCKACSFTCFYSLPKHYLVTERLLLLPYQPASSLSVFPFAPQHLKTSSLLCISHVPYV
jgi:hypothetical protein